MVVMGIIRRGTSTMLSSSISARPAAAATRLLSVTHQVFVDDRSAVTALACQMQRGSSLRSFSTLGAAAPEKDRQERTLRAAECPSVSDSAVGNGNINIVKDGNGIQTVCRTN
ncbi:hypothetical protein PanWU01x14_243290 [Parasponia andersonii]|uniref:Uncharacterized protein n=1 Tax=Parasponia andersonii TaxID=3476 RepID=A0A2P5BFK5_PARAD|nr:hypothetical protein PanWU01x14_243290 [Parasponia andersonii]